MKVTDILNREVASITNCEQEPIHIPGSVQPHGMLIAFDAQSKLINFCSANTETFVGLSATQLLEKDFYSLFPELLRNILAADLGREQLYFGLAYSFNNKDFEVVVHQSGDRIITEWEPKPDEQADMAMYLRQSSEYVELIERSQNLKQLCQSVATHTKKITGYDRVMIYMFDKNYNGHVYAEAKEERLDSFLDLHYPHTDIPPQARQLYLQNKIRMISDVEYEPVPILTVDDGNKKNLDLSLSELRSVSPIHIQYLKNMGVGATLTISVLMDGKLWGLIACHHYTPLRLSLEKRRAALLQGFFLSSQIKVQTAAEEFKLTQTAEAHLQQVLECLPAEEDFFTKLNRMTSLLPMVNASGAIFIKDGELFEKGVVPPADKTLKLVQWLSENVKGSQFNTSFLSQKYAQGTEIARFASGIMYFSLGDPMKNAVLWFRQEVSRTVNWAGDPNENKTGDPVNQLKPRSSFAIWKESVRFTSNAWLTPEINAATKFIGAYSNFLLVEHLQKEEAYQRVLNEKLQQANEELVNLNLLATENIKDPLSKISDAASELTDNDTELSVPLQTLLSKIKQSAQRMKLLMEDVMSYSVVNKRENNFESTDLNTLLQQVLLQFTEEIANTKALVHRAALPTLPVVSYQMRILFTNILSNAFNFRSPERLLQIHIDCENVQGMNINEPWADKAKNYCVVSFSDTGIGIPSEQAEKLFEMFYRADPQTGGTGIGLAICKKIAENHGGGITAASNEDSGTVIKVYLPFEQR